MAEFSLLKMKICVVGLSRTQDRNLPFAVSEVEDFSLSKTVFEIEHFECETEYDEYTASEICNRSYHSKI